MGILQTVSFKFVQLAQVNVKLAKIITNAYRAKDFIFIIPHAIKVI
jgi:hypothetical protein